MAEVSTFGLPKRGAFTIDETLNGGRLGGFIADFEQALVESPLEAADRAGAYHEANRTRLSDEYQAYIREGNTRPETVERFKQKRNPTLSFDDARTLVADRGLSEHLTVPKKGISRDALDLLMTWKDQELMRQAKRAAAPQDWAQFGLGMIAGISASVLDPISLSIGALPLGGPARFLQAATRGGRIARGAAAGLAAGTAEAALTEPLIYSSMKLQQADYDLEDSALNIAFGAAFGAILGGAGGAFRRGLSPARADAPEATPPRPIPPEVQHAMQVQGVEALNEGRPVRAVEVMALAAENDPKTARAAREATNPAGAAIDAVMPQFLRGVDVDGLNYTNGLKEIADQAGVEAGPGIPRTKVIQDIKDKYPRAFVKQQYDFRGYEDTRNRGVFYHGSASEIDALQEFTYDSLNYYGQGFYTSDALDVTHGYANRRGANSPSAYAVSEKRPVRLYNMEEPLAEDLSRFLKAMGNDLVDNAMEENPRNLRELYDAIRDISAGERVSADEVQGIFDSITTMLENKGFGGLQHRGGLRTGVPEHTVRIYFNPKDQVDLKQIDLASARTETQRTEAVAPEVESLAAEIQRLKVLPRKDGRIGPPANESLHSFIVDRGGLNLSDPAMADLKAIVGSVPKRPGFTRKEGGVPFDRMREAAAEAGYFGDARDPQTVGMEEFMDAVRREADGERVFRPSREDEFVDDADLYAKMERALDDEAISWDDAAKDPIGTARKLLDADANNRAQWDAAADTARTADDVPEWATEQMIDYSKQAEQSPDMSLDSDFDSVWDEYLASGNERFQQMADNGLLTEAEIKAVNDELAMGEEALGYKRAGNEAAIACLSSHGVQ